MKRLVVKEYTGSKPTNNPYTPTAKPKPSEEVIKQYLIYGRGKHSERRSEERRIQLQKQLVSQKTNPRLVNLVKDLNLWH
jgi:Zn-dependent M28 family amino/carboxypeptidase